MEKRGRKKGCTKSGGRKAGTPNKISADARIFIKNMLMENEELLMRDFALLEPKDRLLIMERLLNYIIPKRTENSLNANLMDFSQLSEESLDLIISKINES